MDTVGAGACFLFACAVSPPAAAAVGLAAAAAARCPGAIAFTVSIILIADARGTRPPKSEVGGAEVGAPSPLISGRSVLP